MPSASRSCLATSTWESTGNDPRGLEQEWTWPRRDLPDPIQHMQEQSFGTRDGEHGARDDQQASNRPEDRAMAKEIMHAQEKGNDRNQRGNKDSAPTS